MHGFQYAGDYDLRIPESPTTPQRLELRVVNGRLTMGGVQPLIALSETRFFNGGGVFEMVRDEQGRATALLLRAAEGDLRATRIPDGK